MIKVDDLIEIIDYKLDPSYNGRFGFVTKISSDGSVSGTWGSIKLNPETDVFNIYPEILEINSNTRNLLYAYKSYLYDQAQIAWDKYSKSLAEYKKARNLLYENRNYFKKFGYGGDIVVEQEKDYRLLSNKVDNLFSDYYSYKKNYYGLKEFLFNLKSNDFYFDNYDKIYKVQRTYSLINWLNFIQENEYLLIEYVDKNRRFFNNAK